MIFLETSFHGKTCFENLFFDIFLQSFALSSPAIPNSDTRPTQEPSVWLPNWSTITVITTGHRSNIRIAWNAHGIPWPWPWKTLFFKPRCQGAMSDSNVVLFWCEGRNIHHQLVWRHRAMPTHAPWAPTDLKMLRCWRLLIGTLGCPPVRSCAWRKGYWGLKKTNM